jgi:curved DNA-binding protein CbpA
MLTFLVAVWYNFKSGVRQKSKPLQMQAKDTLEITGNLSEYRLFELLAESRTASLNGSFRISSQQFKAIIYIQNGAVILAASNSLRHRLSELLVSSGQISREVLSQVSPFDGDHDLARKLLEKNAITKPNLDLAFSFQLSSILETAFMCEEGEWNFSPLARAKANLIFELDLNQLLFQFAKTLPPNFVGNRILSHEESFAPSGYVPKVELRDPQETYISSRIPSMATFEQISQICNIPAILISPTLYILWLGGFLIRTNYKQAFSDEKLGRLKSSSFHLMQKTSPLKPTVLIQTPTIENVQENVVANSTAETQIIDDNFTMEAYLSLVENANNHYKTLGLTAKADISDIKRVYFQLARLFHPDKFHNEETKLRRRLQDAFTTLAQAYDTLKHKESRELYDFRLRKRKENEEIEEAEVASQPASSAATPKDAASLDTAKKIKLAIQYFNKGFDLLMSKDEEKAVAFLSNAVTLDPSVARYHAYYGKSLMPNKKFRHQAEQELQAALKIEPGNSDFKIMLIEFYIDVGLMKRADGELKRLLSTNPDNKEALKLLDKIANK